jgi:hypothetical protein
VQSVRLFSLTVRVGEPLAVNLVKFGVKPARPALWLRVSVDRLISRSATTKIKDIEAPHFLF